VTWRSKKQSVVALSSVEAKFRAMTKRICELPWLKKLLTKLGYPPQQAMDLLCDNKAAVNMDHNPVQHNRTKHVKINRHFIKEKIEMKIITIPYIRFN
jgi:hypothetical protein